MSEESVATAEKMTGERSGSMTVTPLTYVLRSMKRDSGRVRVSIAGIAICATLLVIFLSLSTGIEERMDTDTEKFREISYALESWLTVLIVMVSLLLGIIIANTLIVSIYRKKRELVTLMALGITRGRVMRLVMMEGIVITVFSLLLGLGVGLVLSLLNGLLLPDSGTLGYFLPRDVDLTTITIALAITVGITLLASAMPAFLIGRMDPTRELRYE